MKEILLVKYGEIILKGGNRSRFEKILIENMSRALRNIAETRITVAQATIYVEVSDNDKIDVVAERLTKIFGIVTIVKACVCEKSVEAIEAAAKEYLKNDLTAGKRFKVEAKRSDKAFPLNSIEIAMEIGGFLDDNFEGLKVDVHNPEVTVKIEVRDSFAYVYCRENRIMGQGGMPQGTGGKATLLLSGGIDSPVAGHMMAKRGMTIEAVNFFSYPYTSERAKEKVIELASILAQYTSCVKLHIVPFTEIQLAIRDNCPEQHMTLLMRRFMMKIAEIIAEKNGSAALITGESAGQVASQTLAALCVTNAVVNMPVLRPLIGMDKTEIIARAEKIGTFETSILPYEDCCTVFTPKNPTTQPELSKILKSEARLDFDGLVAKAVSETEMLIIYPKK